MMLRDLSLYSFDHLEFRGGKELMHRFFKQVNVIHAIHQDNFWLVDTYVFEDTAHTAGVYIVLV